MLTPLVIGHVCGFNATFWVSPSSPEPPPQLRLTASILFARPPACLYIIFPCLYKDTSHIGLRAHLPQI